MTIEDKSNHVSATGDSKTNGERPVNSSAEANTAAIIPDTSAPKTLSVASGARGDLAAATEKNEAWFTKTWGKAVLIGGLVAALANAPGIFNSSVEQTGSIPKTFEAIHSWWAGDARYRGQWTNDTDGVLESGLVGLSTRPKGEGLHEDQGSVSIELNVDRGEATGMVSSRTIAEHRLHTFMFLSGEASRSNISFNVWDFHLGEPVVFAQLSGARYEVEGEERLKFRTLGQAADMFPNEFYVWRGGAMPAEALNLDLLRKMTTLESSAPNAEPGANE